MIRKSIVVLCAVASLGLAGCAAVPCSDVNNYQQAQVGGTLKVPHGLDKPAPDPAFEIPKVARTDGPVSGKSGVCLSTPPDIVKDDKATNSA